MAETGTEAAYKLIKASTEEITFFNELVGLGWFNRTVESDLADVVHYFSHIDEYQPCYDYWTSLGSPTGGNHDNSGTFANNYRPYLDSVTFVKVDTSSVPGAPAQS